jgi:rubredoxin-NAD+ reductase
LAQTLAGNPTAVVFPLMPVAVKTPALPLVVSPPAPATQGTWQAAHEGIWHFVSDGKVRGFVLVGAQTSRRAEQSKLVLV